MVQGELALPTTVGPLTHHGDRQMFVCRGRAGFNECLLSVYCREELVGLLSTTSQATVGQNYQHRRRGVLIIFSDVFRKRVQGGRTKQVWTLPEAPIISELPLLDTHTVHRRAVQKNIPKITL